MEGETEIGETVEIVVAGQRIEAFLSDEVFILDPHSAPARTAIRAYAFALAAAGQGEEAKAILKHVGREG